MRALQTGPWLIALVVFLHGCSSNPTADDAAGGSGGGPTGGDGGGVEVTPMGAGGGLGGADYGTAAERARALGSPDDPNSPLYERIIYFDYDSSNVGSRYQEVVSNHALYLSANPGIVVSLEGHTDERGTREYNLALGEGRALAVADLMMLQGAAPNQIQTLTYGEERPAAIGNSDADLSANRRVEIVYLNQ